jgi:hypothetical protein
VICPSWHVGCAVTEHPAHVQTFDALGDSSRFVGGAFAKPLGHAAPWLVAKAMNVQPLGIV